jgi:hypothetical protein
MVTVVFIFRASGVWVYLSTLSFFLLIFICLWIVHAPCECKLQVGLIPTGNVTRNPQLPPPTPMATIAASAFTHRRIQNQAAHREAKMTQLSPR